MKKPYHPRPGDRVCLNAEGFQSANHAMTSYDAMERAKSMRITYVTPESLTEPEPTWGVEVDHPEINQLMLNSHMFNLIERPAVPWPNKEQPRILELDEAIALGHVKVKREPGGDISEIIIG